MSYVQKLLRAGLFACSVAAIPAAAQPVTPDQTAPQAGSAVQHPNAQVFLQRFHAANTTGDGHLTLAQAEAGHMPMVVRHFNEIDAQHKGYVTLEDIRAYMQQRHAARQ